MGSLGFFQGASGVGIAYLFSMNNSMELTGLCSSWCLSGDSSREPPELGSPGSGGRRGWGRWEAAAMMRGVGWTTESERDGLVRCGRN